MTKSESVAASSHNQGNALKASERFANLREGGCALAGQLESFRGAPAVVVLGIALGGLPVASEVATSLAAPLDFVLIRRLFVPEGYGSQVCAVNVAGSLVLDDAIKPVTDPSTPVEHFTFDAIAELDRRERLCRRGRPPLNIKDKDVILVDCGIRTGLTMKAAVQAVRKLNAKRIIAAVPVSSREGYAAIAPLCDQLICLAQPEQFINAGYWYRDFRRPGDDEVGELLE
jgi:predicted phosphoribosyltransferase